MKTICITEQTLMVNDLLLVTLDGSVMECRKSKHQPATGTGWCRVLTLHNGQVSEGVFTEIGSGRTKDCSHIVWPKLKVHALLRGSYKAITPFEAIQEIFQSKCAAVALT